MSISTAVQWTWSRTLQGVLDDGDDALKLFRGEVTGTLGQVDIGLLADQVGVAATDTLDLGQGVHDLLLAIDVGVEQTDDVLEAVASQQAVLMSRFRPLASRSGINSMQYSSTVHRPHAQIEQLSSFQRYPKNIFDVPESAISMLCGHAWVGGVSNRLEA